MQIVLACRWTAGILVLGTGLVAYYPLHCSSLRALNMVCVRSAGAGLMTFCCLRVYRGAAAAAAAGSGWQGKKVTFGEDAADEDAAEPVQQQQQATAAAEPTAQPSKGSSKSRAGGAASSDGEDTAAGSSSGKKKVKWGSLAVKQLQQAPAGGLKWKKLWPLLLAAATEQQRQQGVKAKSVVDQDSKEKAWQKLQSCSKLQVDGKLVTLAA